MKKENFVIGLVLVGTVAFFLGRMSVSTRESSPKDANKTANSAPATVAAGTVAAGTVAAGTVAAGTVAAAPVAAAPVAAAPAAAPEAAAVAAPAVAAAVPAAAPSPGGAVAVAAPPTAAAAPAAAGEAGTLDGSPLKGPAAAKVTILEVSDYQCPFCSRGKTTMDQVLTTYGDSVALVFKNNPLSFHDHAMPAAKAAMAAFKQGKFWEMYDKLFSNQQNLTDADIEKYATEIGLDLAKFKTDLADAAIEAQIKNEQNAAVALGAGGTPAFFINGKVISGAQPFENFKEVVDAEIKEADALIAAGTALADVHEKRARANIGDKFETFWGSLKGGKPAPAAPAAAAPEAPPPVDPTVWKATVQGHEPVWGKADAPVTIVEFSDFQCPFCSRVEATIKQVRDAYPNDVRIVWKNSPLPFHDRATPAAVASVAALEQGKFWEMHEKLFANQQNLQDADLEKYATEIGLDMTKYKASVTAQNGKPLIDKDLELGTAINARGTPNFFINGRNLVGAVPFEQFKSLIDEELGKAKAKIAAGTPAADVYNQTIANGKTWEPLNSKVNTFTIEDRPVKGALNGDITIYEYSDFQCPFCSRVAPLMKQLVEDPDLKDRVKVVFKHFPLSFHDKAKPAAMASLAANRQGKFWEFHDKIFANQQELSEEKLTEWAKEIGLDMAKFETDRKDPALDAIIQKDAAEGQAADLGGTPTVYVNGRKFEPTSGYSPEAFKTIINKYFPKQ